MPNVWMGMRRSFLLFLSLCLAVATVQAELPPPHPALASTQKNETNSNDAIADLETDIELAEQDLKELEEKVLTERAKSGAIALAAIAGMIPAQYYTMESGIKVCRILFRTNLCHKPTVSEALSKGQAVLNQGQAVVKQGTSVIQGVAAKAWESGRGIVVDPINGSVGAAKETFYAGKKVTEEALEQGKQAASHLVKKGQKRHSLVRHVAMAGVLWALTIFWFAPAAKRNAESALLGEGEISKLIHVVRVARQNLLAQKKILLELKGESIPPELIQQELELAEKLKRNPGFFWFKPQEQVMMQIEQMETYLHELHNDVVIKRIASGGLYMAVMLLSFAPFFLTKPAMDRFLVLVKELRDPVARAKYLREGGVSTRMRLLGSAGQNMIVLSFFIIFEGMIAVTADHLFTTAVFGDNETQSLMAEIQRLKERIKVEKTILLENFF